MGSNGSNGTDWSEVIFSLAIGIVLVVGALKQFGVIS